MNLIPARYLIRFDDFCPTMSWERWQPFEQLLARHGIRPILAVVPDNHDPDLIVDEPIPDFWERMRLLQSEGAVIGLHGYRHLCSAKGKSLVPLQSNSEFSGVGLNQQISWLHSGLAILRNQQLNARIFVAPRHGFDNNTLRALRFVGLPVVSDGLTRSPFVRAGITWIPQQLWEPTLRSTGLWTICIHANTSMPTQFTRLERFLQRHASRFTSLDEVLSEIPPARLSVPENLYASAFLTRFRSRHMLKQLRRPPLPAAGQR